ncbi:MAG: TPM domain-containing protein [Candidatus Omnitrophica bacterium]|nr:TPM domain-containing protein [Candidatus Omnitrophota bacterium]MDD5665472.1 TPM domain-containing protein [Candidatus Omnitrophota bacterium]
MRRRLSLLLFFILFPVFVFAENIPDPSGWVNDFAGVISAEYNEKISAVISQLEEKTGIEIAVATFNSIAPYDEKSYSRMVFDKWKPGKKGKDNGVLMLVAVSQRRWRIETGYGVEGVLPDGLCAQIGRSYMVPYFKSGEYGKGLYEGVKKVASLLAEDANVELANITETKPVRGREKPPLFLYIFAPLFFFVWSLPWPIFISLPVTLLFGFVFFSISPLLGLLLIAGFIASLVVRYRYWKKLPADKRKSFFGAQNYGKGTSTGRWGGGGFGGGGGGGGFGGGRGGGGGGGGGF